MTDQEKQEKADRIAKMLKEGESTYKIREKTKYKDDEINEVYEYLKYMGEI